MKKSLHAFLMTGIVCISISCSRQSVSERDTLALIPVPQEMKVNSDSSVSYTHLTLPTN